MSNCPALSLPSRPTGGPHGLCRSALAEGDDGSIALADAVAAGLGTTAASSRGGGRANASHSPAVPTFLSRPSLSNAGSLLSLLLIIFQARPVPLARPPLARATPPTPPRKPALVVVVAAGNSRGWAHRRRATQPLPLLLRPLDLLPRRSRPATPARATTSCWAAPSAGTCAAGAGPAGPARPPPARPTCGGSRRAGGPRRAACRRGPRSTRPRPSLRTR